MSELNTRPALERDEESSETFARPSIPAPRRSVEVRSERPRIRTLRSGDLLGLDGILAIEHNGEQYTLRRTRNGRLILTK